MRRPAILIVLVLMALTLLAEAPARAALYWADSGRVGRAELDGSTPVLSLPADNISVDKALEANVACGLDVDDAHIYWGGYGVIGRSALDGNNVDQAFISNLGNPCGVTATASHIYWSDFDTNMIGRARLDGSAVEPAFVLGGADPCGIDVVGGYVYWANQDAGSIGRADLGEGQVDQEFISGLGEPCGVAVDGAHIFWGDQSHSSIGRANLDGSAIETEIVAAAGEPWDLAVSGEYVFWADRGGGFSNPGGGIGRAALDGTAASYDLVPETTAPTGVALDSRPATTKPVPPSGSIRYGKLTHRRDGSVALVVNVPGSGELKVDRPAIPWHVETGEQLSRAGPFRWTLRLWPGKGTAPAKRIRRQLRRRGRASVVLHLSYQQEGHTPFETARRIAFLRPKLR